MFGFRFSDGDEIRPTPTERRRGPRTIATRELARLNAAENIDAAPADIKRPKTRGDCVDGMRPCPFISCKHHLFLDVNERTGSLKLNFPDGAPDIDPAQLEVMPATCSLDVADEGGASLSRVGEVMNLTRERVRQQQERIIHKSLPVLQKIGVTPEDACED